MAHPDPRPEAPEDHWRSRYLRSIDELQERERRWAEVQDLLARALRRVASLARGANPPLEDALDRLGRAARDGAETDALAEAAYAFDEAAKSVRPGVITDRPSEAGNPTLEPVLQFLERCDLPPRLAATVATARGRGTDGRGAAHAPLERIALELSETLRSSGRPLSDPGPESRRVLGQLLDQLELPELEPLRVSHLRARLDRPLGPAEITLAVDDIGALLREAEQRCKGEQRAVQGFLQEVTAKLAELDTSLGGALLLQGEGQKDRQALRDQVREEVSRLRTSVDRAGDFAALRQMVQTHLSAVEGHVATYLRREDERRLEGEDRARRMADRVRELEEEAARLKESMKRARERATHDPLTGVFNRLAYEERLSQEYSRWKRYRKPLSLLVLDVDHFKAVNDHYGHPAGDRVLKGLAAALSSLLRECDLLARYGGEEFVVVLPETAVQAAATVAEKLRAGVQATAFRFHDEPVPVTVSCGLAEFGAEDTPDKVFERADRALYRAKQSGRNRCEVG
jgi:diguanylate cyclase